ncbi:VWA domain-containing protein [Photobacterium sp. ZSDE20]|uniref:VWA domain-containing protein n=1 Tax=Photobacterium pectinilyticum TaxID=2906793 RepID=A0ABT1N2M5_9GAMM|nr:VWA domain-containing protein [Photobacterium sp. ZSDE20]MCQ1058987.1 VWA domain-containing protein [Photobacterium sp. ZSDE20]MDD1823998.1 VWA domain-containing protein [Photobacterium sp. ZSDE20]
MFDSLSLQQVITQFHFIRPLWLLAFIPMGLLFWLRWREANQPGWKDVLPDHLRKVLTIGEKGWSKQLPLKLLTLIITIGVLVCAGPTWQRQASPFGEDKASMLVLLDSSESMLEQDLPPSRLERAKQKVRDLLALRQGGSTGLAVFAGSAHVAMPMTQDTKVFEPILAAISPEIMPVEGKFAEKSLPLIDQLLQGKPGSTVLLVSDGTNPNTIAAFKSYFSDKPYQLMIFGAGNNNVVSDAPADFDSLRQLASEVNGRFIEMTVDSSDVEQLNRSVERNMQLNGESSMPWQDMGYQLLLPIALVMLLWFRKGWLVQWCVVLSLTGSLLVAPTVKAETVVASKAQTSQPAEVVTTWDKAAQWWWDLWLTPDQQGQRLLNQGEYLDAAKHFVDPLRKGTAYYYASEYKQAHRAFLQMDSDFGLYNAASALARQREYLAARDLLQSLADKKSLAAELRPSVEHNLDVIGGIVDEINLISESQAGTTDGPEESFELNDDKPRTADGADEITAGELMIKDTLNANEILGSNELADKWLKRVEADPKYFLRAKFQLQLNEPSHTTVSNGTSEAGEAQQ